MYGISETDRVVVGSGVNDGGVGGGNGSVM